MKRYSTLIALLALVLATAAFAKGKSDDTKHAAVKITSGPNVEGTGDTWAVIAWTTNEPSSSIIRYGTSPSSLTDVAESPYSDQQGANQQMHRVHLKNLKPFTTYYFVVDSGQGAGTGTQAMSSIGTFATRQSGSGTAANNSTPAAAGEADENRKHAAVRIINGPRVEGTGDTWAVIAWTTNEASSSIIRYGTDPSSLSQVAESPYADNENANKQTHRVRITNLKPHTTYYFVVDSGQGEGTGTETRSNVTPFTTK